MTSLATQLAALSADNLTVVDRQKRKQLHSVSLIFEPKVAAAQDYETIYSVALEGLQELIDIDPAFQIFENTLFAESSIRVDREVQSQEENDHLDAAIANFMSLVAPRLNLEPSIKAVEWLVRRFNAHILNAESLLLAALPYYSQPVFVRFLDVVTLPPRLAFLANAKKAFSNPPRNLMIRALASEPASRELICEYSTRVIFQGRGFHELLAFWSSMVIWTMVSMRDFGATDEQVADAFLAYISKLIVLRPDGDAQIASYMVLAVLASQFNLDIDVRRAAIQSILLNWTTKGVSSGLACISQLIRAEDPIVPFKEVEWTELAKIKNFDDQIVALATQYKCDAFVATVCASLFEYNQHAAVVNILTKVKIADLYMVDLAKIALRQAKAPKLQVESRGLLAQYFEKSQISKPVVDAAFAAENMDIDTLELALQSSLKFPWSDEEQTVANDEENLMDLDTTSEQQTVELPTSESKTVSFLSAGTKIQNEFSELAKAYNHISTQQDALESLKLADSNGLTFLARLWSSNAAHVTRVHAFEHAASVFERNPQVDYQGVLPLLFIGLADPSERIRRSSGKALTVLRARYPMKKPEFWAMDIIYGPGKLSDDVKWLGSSEVSKLVSSVCDQLEECYQDPAHIHAVLNGVAKKSSSEQVLHYFASHILSIQLVAPRTKMLSLVRGWKHMFGNLEELCTSYVQQRPKFIASESLAHIEEYDAALVNLAASDRHGVASLEKFVKSPYEDLAEKASHGLIKLWPRLKSDAQLDLFKVLCDIALDDNLPFDTLPILNEISISFAQFDAVLDSLQLTSVQEKATVAKRRRRSSSNKVHEQGLLSTAEKHVRKVTMILELLDKTLRSETDLTAGTVDIATITNILGHLFAVLSEILALGTESNLPVEYSEQLLASAMTALVDLVKKCRTKATKIDSGKMRVDIIVSCIRASSSPQVQNRFLLLISALAELIPELVLHSVMPIFTFMGANTVRQDDEFSAHVIQQTISSVVPALVGKEEETEFVLLSFIAAFPHIPRHRRVRMFGTLIRCIGVSQSLYRFLYLLGGKFAEARLKHRTPDAKMYVQFTQHILPTFSVGDQLSAIEAYLDCVANRTKEAQPESTGTSRESTPMATTTAVSPSPSLSSVADLYTFLNMSIPEDLRAKMATVTLAGGEEQELVSGYCARIVERLLDARGLATSKDIDTALTAVTSKFLSLLPISQFVAVVGRLLKSGPEEVKMKALVLVQSKFADESPADENVVSAASSALDNLEEFVCSKNGHVATSLALDGLESIVSQFGSKMDADQLTHRVATAVGPHGLQSSDTVVFISAVGYVASLTRVLGARVIGHFAQIVPVVFARVRSEPDNKDVHMASFALIAGLVKRIPSFMTSSLATTLELVSLSSVCELEIRSRLIATIYESSIDATTLISALAKTVKALQQHSGLSSDSYGLLCEFFDGTVNKASGKAVSMSATQLFEIVLELFSVRERKTLDDNDTNRVEARTISSALAVVMKLNDKTFRPHFVHIAQWATEQPTDESVRLARLTVFYKFVVKLLGNLKSIVTSYYGYLVDTSCSILDTDKSASTSVPPALKRAVLNSLVLSFQHDHDDFWQSQERFDKICECLVGLIPFADSLSGPLLVRAVVALASVSSPELHKQINEALVVHMRSECSSNEKMWVARTLHGLYDKLGEEWVSQLPQLVPLIAELLEDDDEAVELEVRRKLVPVVEEVLGESLDRYLS